MEYSESPHRPLHIYNDDAWYFITASTVHRARILKTPAHCYVWCAELFAAVAALKLKLAAWALLQNHYHLLVELPRGRDLSSFMKTLHGRTSYVFNELDSCRGRQVWYSYWDLCIRNEDDFWARLNYIHYKPVHHGYVDYPEDWEFSSYRGFLRNAGRRSFRRRARDQPVTT